MQMLIYDKKKMLLSVFLMAEVIQGLSLVCVLNLVIEILGPFQTLLFSCAEPNANELEQRILLIYIRFGTWEEQRLKRA